MRDHGRELLHAFLSFMELLTTRCQSLVVFAGYQFHLVLVEGVVVALFEILFVKNLGRERAQLKI